MSKNITTSRRKLAISATLILCVIVALALMGEYFRNLKRTRDYIDGKIHINIKRIYFSGQQLEANCISKPVIEYFTNCFNKPRIRAIGGLNYTADITTTDGVTFAVYMDLTPDNKLSMWEIGVDFHGGGLEVNNPPKEIQDLFRFLKAATPGSKGVF